MNFEDDVLVADAIKSKIFEVGEASGNDDEIELLQGAVETAVGLLTPIHREMLLGAVRVACEEKMKRIPR